ncbi:hypothetical protein ILYODFUR_013375 [Ilyodon furcidens]|uniref:Uncharacterized protein n=1 Tax=Ilyodon furcidens TaxID=33524 RepID=A0ABV0SWY1_9TELE
MSRRCTLGVTVCSDIPMSRLWVWRQDRDAEHGEEAAWQRRFSEISLTGFGFEPSTGTTEWTRTNTYLAKPRVIALLAGSGPRAFLLSAQLTPTKLIQNLHQPPRSIAHSSFHLLCLPALQPTSCRLEASLSG